MNQQVIKKLLEEASSPECSEGRKTAIQCELGKASCIRENNNIQGKEAGIELILDQLYVEVLENNPKLLPNFFPVFAMICGDREKGSLIADIDWSLLEK